MRKYHCTADLLFDLIGISYMTTDNLCFYLQNRLIQTSKTMVNGTVILPPLGFPGFVRHLFIDLGERIDEDDGLLQHHVLDGPILVVNARKKLFFIVAGAPEKIANICL
jgi:hypothetical protein